MTDNKRKSGDNTLVAKEGPGGHFISEPGTPDDEVMSVILGGAQMDDLTDKDGNPPAAIAVSIRAAKAPEPAEPQPSEPEPEPQPQPARTGADKK